MRLEMAIAHSGHLRRHTTKCQCCLPKINSTLTSISRINECCIVKECVIYYSIILTCQLVLANGAYLDRPTCSFTPLSSVTFGTQAPAAAPLAEENGRESALADEALEPGTELGQPLSVRIVHLPTLDIETTYFLGLGDFFVWVFNHHGNYDSGVILVTNTNGFLLLAPL